MTCVEITPHDLIINDIESREIMHQVPWGFICNVEKKSQKCFFYKIFP